MTRLLFLVLMLFTLGLSAQTRDTTKINADEQIRFDRIDSTLHEYGKQQTVANKITVVSILFVVGGTVIGVPTMPLLVATSMCDLATLIVSSKANKRLSGNTPKRKRKHENNR